MDTFSNVTTSEERLVLSATQKRIPLGGAFELLPLCNMDCRMCFLRLSPEEMKHQGHLRSAEEWLEIAGQAQKAGLLFLLLTGGEPFLYPDFSKLYQGLCKLGLIITINSNGTLITEELADILAAHKPRRVNITLYGSSDEIYGELCKNPYGFTQTLKGIQLLKERNISSALQRNWKSPWNPIVTCSPVPEKAACPLMIPPASPPGRNALPRRLKFFLDQLERKHDPLCLHGDSGQSGLRARLCCLLGLHQTRAHQNCDASQMHRLR